MSQLEFEFIRKARRKSIIRNFVAVSLALGTLLTFVFLTYGYLQPDDKQDQYHQRIDDLSDAERANR